MTLVHRTLRLTPVAGVLLVVALAAAPALAKDVGVNIVDRTYDPATIDVAVGDTLTWTVTKAIGEPHSVTSGKPGDAAPGTIFDSKLDKLQENGGTFSFTFTEAGTYDYFCTVHATVMTGTVVVTAAGSGEAHAPVPQERKLLGGAILIATLVVLFGAAWVWRRMNPA